MLRRARFLVPVSSQGVLSLHWAARHAHSVQSSSALREALGSYCKARPPLASLSNPGDAAFFCVGIDGKGLEVANMETSRVSRFPSAKDAAAFVMENSKSKKPVVFPLTAEAQNLLNQEQALKKAAVEAPLTHTILKVRGDEGKKVFKSKLFRPENAGTILVNLNKMKGFAKAVAAKPAPKRAPAAGAARPVSEGSRTATTASTKKFEDSRRYLHYLYGSKSRRSREADGGSQLMENVAFVVSRSGKLQFGYEANGDWILDKQPPTGSTIVCVDFKYLVEDDQAGELMDLMRKGHGMWCCSYAEYLLSGQHAKTVSALLKNRSSAAKANLVRHNHVKEVFASQVSDAANSSMLLSIKCRMEGMICTSEMEGAGLALCSKESLVELKKQMNEERVGHEQQLVSALRTAGINKLLQSAWNWNNTRSIATLVCGGTLEALASSVDSSLQNTEATAAKLNDDAKAILELLQEGSSDLLFIRLETAVATTANGTAIVKVILKDCATGATLYSCPRICVDGPLVKGQQLLSNVLADAGAAMQKALSAAKVSSCVLVHDSPTKLDGFEIMSTFSRIVGEAHRLALVPSTFLQVGNHSLGGDFAALDSSSSTKPAFPFDSVEEAAKHVWSVAKGVEQPCIVPNDTDRAAQLRGEVKGLLNAGGWIDEKERNDLIVKCGVKGTAMSVNDKSLQLLEAAAAGIKVAEAEAIVGLAEGLRGSRSMDRGIHWLHEADSKHVHDGRIHHTLKHTTAVTGRLSCSNPNAQSIPKTDVRKMFVSRYGASGRIVEADFSQLEVIVQACLTKDKEMVKDLKNKVDFHCKRVTMIHPEYSYDEVVQKAKVEQDPVFVEMRQQAKVFSFQRQYGAGPKQIAESSGMAIATVNKLIEREREVYTGLTSYYEMAQSIVSSGDKLLPKSAPENVLQRAYFPTVSGVQYDMRGAVRGSGFAPVLLNYPVQGFAGELVQLVLGKLFRKFADNGFYGKKANLVNTVHDSVWIDCTADVLQEVARDTKLVMEGVPKYANEIWPELQIDLDFPISLSAGPTLGEQSPFEP